jgi:putative spermidine/putrescine transport system permease protein
VGKRIVSRLTKSFYYSYCGIVFLFLILPVLIIIPMSFSSSRFLKFPPPGYSLQWYKNFFFSSEWMDSAFLSVKVALCSMALSVILGTLAAFGLARSRFKGKELLNTLLMAPMVIPVIILAVGIYFYFSRLGLIDTALGLILSHTILALPLVIISVLASLKGLDRDLELAAMSLGANPITTFLNVTLPLIRPGVISGALFAFAISFDEIVIAIFLCSSRAVTLPKRMWDGIRFGLSPTITAASVLFIVMAVFLILLVTFILRIRADRAKGYYG